MSEIVGLDDCVYLSGPEVLLKTCVAIKFVAVDDDDDDDDEFACHVSALRCRLSGASATEHEGRLEVYHRHRWRTVCDRRFGDTEARVVCFSLGFPR